MLSLFEGNCSHHHYIVHTCDFILHNTNRGSNWHFPLISTSSMTKDWVLCSGNILALFCLFAAQLEQTFEWLPVFAWARSYLPETQRHRRLINPAVNIDRSPVPFCGLEEKSADLIPRSFISEPSIDWEQSGRFAKDTVAQTGICAQLLITENESFKDFFRFHFGFQCNVFFSSSHHLFHSLLLSEEPHLLPIPHLLSIFLQTWKAASSFSLQKVPPLLPGPASLPPLPCHTQVHLWTLTAHILNLNHFPPPRGHIEYPRPMTCSNYFASLRKLKDLIFCG